MKNLTLIILILIFANVYSQNKYSPNFSTIISANNGLVMLNQCSRSTPENINGFFELAKNDIEQLEENFKNIYSLKSTKCCYAKKKIQNLENFAFQYIGVNINNEKYIYINALGFSNSDEVDESKPFFKNWKTLPISVCDGGSSYWGVLYNIRKKKFSQLSINGSI
jgi:hypothetical protein